MVRKKPLARSRRPIRRTALARSRKPIKKKRAQPRRGRLLDRDYKGWIATLGCVICGQIPVEVAHVGERGLSQKSSDHETAPLCVSHHREGPEAHHGPLGKRWWEYHGLDREKLFAELRETYRTWRAEARLANEGRDADVKWFT